MFRLRTAAVSARALWAGLFALALAVRLLSPAGFMPAFEHGSILIVSCPDYEPPAALMAHHHHGDPKKIHQPCPFASGTNVGAIDTQDGWLASVLVLGGAILLGRSFRFLERHRRNDRPPLRGPPFPA